MYSGRKKLYVGTVNGENSLTNKKAKTFIRARNSDAAALGLFRRYKKIFGKANVTEIFYIDEITKKPTKVPFNLFERYV